MGGVCDIEGQRCNHPIACEAGGCVKQRRAPKPTPPQDSVSDVERMRAIGDALLARPYLSDLDRERVRTLLSAALAVPINKIGEDAGKPEVYGGFVNAFYTVAEMLGIGGAQTQSPQTVWSERMLPVLRELVALKQATPAIRRLSTSIDKGVSNGR